MNDNNDIKNIAKRIMKYEKRVSIYVKSLAETEMLIESLLNDFPAIFHVDSISYSFNPKSEIAVITPEYILPEEEYKKYLDKVLLKLTELRNRMQGLSESGIELYVHDYLCKNVRYSDFGKAAHTIAGPLISGKGVCDGISKTASTLFHIMNMESKVISGQADGGINHKGPHAWNIVKVNGKWQNLDITFDNTTSLFIPNHRYFNISTKDLLKDHSPNEKSIRIMNEKGMH